MPNSRKTTQKTGWHDSPKHRSPTAEERNTMDLLVCRKYLHTRRVRCRTTGIGISVS